MNILVLGSGGREHALAMYLKKSKRCDNLFIAPGNAGTFMIGKNIDISFNDFEAVKKTVIENNIHLVVVGPEEPLVRGIVDFFAADAELKNVLIFGPSKNGAQLEGSKAFSKKFMQRHNIPTAAYKEITDIESGITFLQSLTPPYVLKADGLAAGKGVVILNNFEEAVTELKKMLDGKFGAASRTVVIEEFLTGTEFSVFALTDGKTYRILPEAKDYKRIGEGDSGLNTGGMGAVSPVPFFDAAMRLKVETKIIKPTIEGLQKENLDYKGVVFFGLINVQGEPFVIEYNCRFGDPETEVIIPRIKNDLVTLFEQTLNGKLSEAQIATTKDFVVGIVLTAGGYPEEYEKGDEIFIENADQSLPVFHAGTKAVNGKIVTNGGRILVMRGSGESIEIARKNCLENLKKINYKGKYFRSDIGRDLLLNNEL